MQNKKFKVKNLSKEKKLKIREITNLNFLGYEKPQVLSERFMGVAALACGKCAAAGLRAQSFTCKQLPSGS